MRKKRILFIGTGGTIGSTKTVDGLKPSISSEELLSYFPETQELAQIDAVQLFSLDSTNVEPKHWTELAKCIEQNYQQYDAFIIGHGTDTLHFTASAISFGLRNIEKPIIFTGSVLSLDTPNSDAKQNFIDSTVLAISDIKGVFICFHGQVIMGTNGRKMKNEATKIDRYKEVFSSINMPVFAVIQGRNVIKNSNFNLKIPYKKNNFYIEANFDTNIGFINLFPGLEGNILDSYANKKAILLKGYGPGNIPFAYGNWNEKITEFTKKGIPIFISTQNPFGEVDLEKYEVGQKAAKAGGISTYDMTSGTAIVKLMWIYGNSPNISREKAIQLFHTNIAGEINI